MNPGLEMVEIEAGVERQNVIHRVKKLLLHVRRLGKSCHKLSGHGRKIKWGGVREE